MKSEKQRANAIVNLILGDLQDRCGLGNAWDEIDSEIKKEIADAWVDIVIEELKEK